MKRLSQLILWITLLLFSCESVVVDLESTTPNVPLSLSVQSISVQTKEIHTEGYLPNGKVIGVFLREDEKETYDKLTYTNIPYTAVGEGTEQKWENKTSTPVLLSTTPGYVTAYYPYQKGNNDLTKIPVTTEDQIDYLFAQTPNPVSAHNSNVTLTMHHALAALRFNLSRGSFSGTGQITALSVQSDGFAKSATLDATTGKLSNYASTGEAISLPVTCTLEDNPETIDIIVVPTGESAYIELRLTIDAKSYQLTIPTVSVTQGSLIQYDVILDATEISLSDITVGGWSYNRYGAPTLQVNGHQVTIEGEISSLAFQNSVNSDGSVLIKAASLDAITRPKKPTITGATATQTVNGHIREITLTDLSAQVTVTFSGIETDPWETITTDGIYYISEEYEPTTVASNTCAGVVLVKTAVNQRIWIEKYENANNAASIALYKSVAQQLGGSYTYYFSWGAFSSLPAGLPIYSSNDGSSSVLSYLPNENGTYYNTPHLSGDYANWKGGVLSDFYGSVNTPYITAGATISPSGTLLTPMAYLVKAFNSTDTDYSVNHGFYDWVIPGGGQLALIWMNLLSINNALTAIGGTPLAAEGYWSSSCYSQTYGWGVRMDTGQLGGNSTNDTYRVRLIRTL